jgi:hypothetical protein
MHRPYDVLIAPIARRRTFENYPGLFRGRAGGRRHQPITPKTTTEC